MIGYRVFGCRYSHVTVAGSSSVAFASVGSVECCACPGIAEKSSTGAGTDASADSRSTCPGIAEKFSLLVMYTPLVV